MCRVKNEPTTQRHDVGAPVLDEVARLEFALVMTRSGGRRRADGSRGDGTSTEEPVDVHLLERLEPIERARVRRQAEDLAGRGVGAVVRGVAGYPTVLRRATGNRPRALFHRGPIEILDRPGIGICGSRNASSGGIRAASLSGALAARCDLPSISGHARGVDTATHVASLEAGGHTVLVLPEGIDHFRPRRDGVRRAWDPARALVLSQFAPTQPWTVHGAMARNASLIGLSTALVVVEAGETGGTLAAGRRALALGCRVLVLEFAANTPGNRVLLAAGAIAVRDAVELEELLCDLDQVDEDRSPARARDASSDVLHLI